MCFVNSGLLKNMVRSMPRMVGSMPRLRRSVEKQHGKCTQTIFKFEEQVLYHIYWSMQRQLPFKKSLLVICEISRVFPNTLSANGKYSLLDRDNLTQWIQTKLPRKQKTFSQFFSSFLKSSLNVEHFRKKHDPHSWCISEIRDFQTHV